MHLSGALGISFGAVLGTAQLQVRTLEAVFACSIDVGATRFDRFDSLLGSISVQCTCHRVPP
eukprot:7518082-Alexandrium_andersonii.AAC.1